MSRQIFSSPFDAPQRPRKATASHQRIHHVRGKRCGGSISNLNNIMVDSRVVRLNTFHRTSENNTNAKLFRTQQPVTMQFDSRLIMDDTIFANPIVTISGEDADNKQQSVERKTAGCGGERPVTSTPSPVKGRRHISVQTVGDSDRMDADAGEAESTIMECAAQTLLIGRSW